MFDSKDKKILDILSVSGREPATSISAKIGMSVPAVIDRINKLGGNHRWALRWFKPPEIDEISISFTKDGQLAFFNHIIPDTLAGDLLPQNIALDRVKSFLKTLPPTSHHLPLAGSSFLFTMRNPLSGVFITISTQTIGR